MLYSPSLVFIDFTLHKGGPLIDGLLALEALSAEVRETLVERDLHHLIVNQPGPALGKHPEVVSEDEASKDVNRVVCTAEDQHESHSKEGQKSRILELVVALLSELEEVDHT